MQSTSSKCLVRGRLRGGAHLAPAGVDCRRSRSHDGHRWSDTQDNLHSAGEVRHHGTASPASGVSARIHLVPLQCRAEWRGCACATMARMPCPRPSAIRAGSRTLVLRELAAPFHLIVKYPAQRSRNGAQKRSRSTSTTATDLFLLYSRQ